MENFFDRSFLFSKDPMFLCSHVKGIYLSEDPLENEQSLKPGSCQAIPKSYQEGLQAAAILVV